MYNNYYQPTPAYTAPQVRSSLTLKGRPVSSLDEARASTIDFDGTVFYFPDLANKRIYTKQINLDGTASLLMYELKEIPMPAPEPTGYITREEFEATISQIRDCLPAPIAQTSNSVENRDVPEFKF